MPNHSIRLLAGLLLILLVLPMSIRAQDCLHYGDYLSWQSRVFQPLEMAFKVTLAGDLAYVSDLSGDMHVVAFADDGTAHVSGSVTLHDYPHQVLVLGDKVIAAAGSSGLEVVDVGDPEAPTIVATIPTPGYAHDLAAAENHIYVADSNGLQIYAAPLDETSQPVGSLVLPPNVIGIDVAHQHAYVLISATGLAVVSVTDPTAPTLVTTLPAAGSVYDILVDGDRAFVTDEQVGVRIYDLSEPSAPIERASVPLPSPGMGLALEGTLLFVADGTTGLVIVDIADADEPVVVGQYPTAEWAMGVAVAGPRVCVTDFQWGLQVFDATHLVPAPLASSLDLAAPAADVALAGDLACIAAGPAGLQIVDLANPEEPTPLAIVDTPGSARGVDVSGSYAFVADFDGVRTVSLVEPGTPWIAGSVDLDFGAVNDLAVAGSMAYVACGAGLIVLDVAEPAEPTEVTSLDLSDHLTDVVIAGDHLYLVGTGTQLHVVSVADPTAPIHLGSVNLSGRAFSLAVQDDYVYAGTVFEGLRIVDVSDPTAPVLSHIHYAMGEAASVSVSGDLLWLGGGSGILEAYDLEDGLPVRYLGGAVLPADAASIAIENGLAVAVGTSASLAVAWPPCEAVTAVEDQTPPTPIILTAFPNPFNPQTTLRYRLATAGPVRVTIHDVRGRRIRTLVAGVQAAGNHAVTWRGHDDLGRRMPSGVYLARLATPDGQDTTKLVLVQ